MLARYATSEARRNAQVSVFEELQGGAARGNFGQDQAEHGEIIADHKGRSDP